MLKSLRTWLRKHRLTKPPQGLDLLALEDRVLFSASPVADEDVDLSFTDADWDIHNSDNVTDDFCQAFDAVENALRIELPENFSADSLLTDNASADRRELIVVDTSVTDFERLLEEIQSQSDSISQYEILLLNPAGDGVQQIADALKSLGGVDALHVLSHADEGSLLLGSQRLTNANLVEHANALLDWRANLRDGADILLYGCDLAGNESGLSLLQGLHDLTGADIAASNDTTGNEASSGDWDLEVAVGSIQTDVLHAEAWDGKLAVILVDTLLDVVDAGDGFTSLREAIIQANANADADEIRLTVPGTYILTLTGELEDLAATGDLDILHDVSIVGLDANSTIVDANHLDRVFDVAAGIEVSFSKLSIINGDATVGNASGVGGGIRDSGATIELKEVIFSGNHAEVGGGARFTGMVTANDVYFHSNTAIAYGGAIRNQGNLTISNATFANNSANQGGAVENRNGTLSLTNATFANNSATTGDGGAIYNTGQVSLQNVTIANNTAQTDGGGINNISGGVVNLANTLVANNFGSGGSVDDDLSGVFSSNGSNFVRTVGTATGLQPADITNTDPLLGALTDNGGFAPTMRLLSTSLAIDGGNTTGAPTTDQTGELRDAAPDIGAYEYRPAVEFDPTGDLQVNVTTSDQQVTSSEVRGSRQAIAIDQNGNYVVVWSSNQTSGADGNGYGVMARMYNSSGTALTSEFLVNQTIAGDQQWAQVARADDGSFVVTWTSHNGTDNDVYYRVYNADGTARTNELLANVTTTGNQENASVSINRNTGDFVIAWEGAGASDSDGVFFRRFDANGNALDGAEIQANTVSGDSESDTSVSMNRSGEFAVSWTGDGDLFVRKYASNGSALTSAIKTNTANNVSGQSVALRDSGDFIVAARSDVFLSWGTYYRVYNGDGSTAKNWEQVAYGSPTAPSISVDANGNYVIVYEGSNDGDQSGIRARVYQADHSAYRTIDVNHFATGDQDSASVAMGNLDNLVFAWSGNGESDTSGVFARQFGTRTDTLIRQAGTSITVDGTVDGIWAGAISNSVSLLASGTIDNATDLSATWSSLWDSTYLYFLVDVDDDILEGTGTDHFTDDIVELFVGQQITGESTYDADEYHLGIRAIDNTLVVGPNSATDTSGILHAVTTNATGYTVEVAIPWSRLGVSPTSGYVIGLEVQVGDDDDGGSLDGELAWQDSTGQAANDPRVFGSATLVGVSNSAPDVTAGGPYEVGMGENLLLSEASAFDVDGDSLSFAWDLNGNGIFGEANEPTSASASISWTALESMGVSSLGTHTIQLRADDGNGGVRVSSTTFTVTAPERGLWFSSVGNGSSTDLPNFDAGTIVRIGGTGFALEPSGATAGQMSELFEVDNFLSGADVNALHYVTTDMSVGGDTFAAFDLVKGDVLFSLKTSGTLVSSNSLAVTKEDVVVFRPDTVGDFSSGSFFTLLDDPLGAEIRGVTLVESDTHVGEATLTAGSFLLVRSGGAEDSNVYWFDANDVGAGSTSGTTHLLLDGADVGISDKLFGIELIESAVSLGGALLTEGQLVLAIDNDSSVGDNGLAVTRHDFFVLNVSQTSLAGTGAATASLLMDGSDVQLSDNSEAIDAIALFAKSSAPIAINDTATVAAGSAQTIDLTANDLDADGGAFQIVDIGSPSLGTVINNGDGTVTYTAVDGTDGNDSFTYIISDGSDGLTHFWGLNGNAIDSMGSADGTINGATTVSGAYGDALQFDEINDYVSLPDITYNNEFTVSFKFKIDDNSGNEYQYLYSHGDADGPESLNVMLGEWSNSSGYSGIIKTVFGDENDSYVINALNFNAGSAVGTGWHTYTLTVDATNGARVYLDGELKASNASRGGDAFNPDGNLVLGGREDLNSIRFLGGELDSVAVFGRSLSLDEVSALTSDHLTTLATSAAQVSIDVNDTVDITSNLVLHLQLDDGSGTTAVDSSVGGNDANLVGDQDWQVGAVGGGFHFDYSDGTEDFFEVPNSPSLENLQEADYYTLSAWFLPDNAPPDTNESSDRSAYGVLVKEGEHTGIWYQHDGRFQFETWLAGNTPVVVESTQSYAPGQFYHLAVTVDRPAGEVRLYVNGQLDGTTTFTPGQAAMEYGTEPWRIGTADDSFTGNDYAYPAAGVIDDVRIYERKLTSADITALYELAGPTSIQVDNDQLSEGTNSSGGYVVGTLAAVDANASETFTYAVVGGTDQSKFYIAGVNGNKLVINDGVLDYETQSSYQVVVRATDSTGLSFDQTLTIQVIDQNESPTITSTDLVDRTIREDQSTAPLAFTIGDVETAASSLIVSATSNNTSIIPNSNLVLGGTGANRTLTITPTADAFGGPVTITLNVSDGTEVTQETFNITVSPVLDYSSVWLSTQGDVSNTGSPGVESWSAATVVQLADPNLTLGLNSNGTFSPIIDFNNYAFNALSIDSLHYVSSNVSVGATTAMALQRGDLLLSTASTENFVGATSTFTVLPEEIFVYRPTAIDDYSSGTVMRLISDAGSNVTGVSLVEVDTVVGGTTLHAGQLVYTRSGSNDVYVMSVDDAGLNSTFTEQVLLDLDAIGLTAGGGIDVVEVDSSLTDQFFAAGTMLFRFGHGITAVEFSDTEFGGGTSGSTTIVLDTTDLSLSTSTELLSAFSLTTTNLANNAPIDLSLSNVTVTENTDTTGGHVVATISGTDPDGDALFYSIVGGTDASKFWIAGTNNDRLVLADGVLDFEAKDSYAVTLRVTDNAGEFYDESFTIQVQDQNELPSIALTSAITSMTENNVYAAGTTVATFTVTDDALGTNSVRLTGPDAGRFAIVGNQVQLANNLTPNFEAKSSYNVSVVVDDSSLGGNSDDADAVTIHVQDQNEAPTVSLTNVVSTLSESASLTAGQVVADIVIDDDALGTNSLSLVGDAIFEIVGNQLRIKAGSTLDYENATSHSVRIHLDDTTVGGTPDDFVDYTLHVANANEAHTINAIANQVVNEDSPTGLIPVVIVDPEGLESGMTVQVTSNDTSVVAPSGIALVHSGGSLQGIRLSPVDNAFGAVTITVTVSDGQHTATTSFVLDVQPVNDGPTTTGLGTITVAENSDTRYLNVGNRFHDVDDTALTYSIVSNSNPALTIASLNSTTGVLTVDFAANTVGSSTFIIRATDPDGAFVDAVGQIVVYSTNEAPVVQNLNLLLSAGETIQGNAALVASDADGDTLTFIIVTEPVNGIVSWQQNGEFTYTAHSDFFGREEIHFRVFDGTESTLATIRLDVFPVDLATLNNTTQDETQNSTTAKNEDAPSSVTTAATPESAIRPPSAEPPATVRPAAQNSTVPQKESVVSLPETVLATTSLASQSGSLDEAMSPAAYSSPTGRQNSQSQTMGTDSTILIRSYAYDVQTNQLRQMQRAVWDSVDDIRRNVMHEQTHEELVFSTATLGLTSSFTVGYLLWTVRSGLILSSLLAQMPAWTLVDPLPILGQLGNLDDEDDESLDAMVSRHDTSDPDDMHESEETSELATA